MLGLRPAGPPANTDLPQVPQQRFAPVEVSGRGTIVGVTTNVQLGLPAFVTNSGMLPASARSPTPRRPS